MMRIVTVAGGRADEGVALSRELRGRVDLVLVHVVPEAKRSEAGAIGADRLIELPTGEGARGIVAAMTALEAVAEELRPDAVLVCGDGDAALAAALVAVKLGVPQIRVGAGVRSGERGAADEINRAVADRVCDLLLCADEAALANLRGEGLEGKTRVVGEVEADPRVAAEVVYAWLEAHASSA